MVEKAPLPAPGFPEGLPPSPGLLTGYPTRQSSAGMHPTGQGTATGTAVMDRPPGAGFPTPTGTTSPEDATPAAAPSQRSEQSPFAPQSPSSHPGPSPAFPAQSPFAQQFEQASPFTAPPGRGQPPPSPSPFSPPYAQTFQNPYTPDFGVNPAQNFGGFPSGIPIRARSRPAGPPPSGQPHSSAPPFPYPPAPGAPNFYPSPSPPGTRLARISKGPLIAGALACVALIAVVSVVFFASSPKEKQVESVFGSYSVEELANVLPSQAPDSWTIIVQRALRSTPLYDGLGPDNGSWPVDPTLTTEPENCANPLHTSSISWAASARLRSQSINPITSLPDSVVIMVGVIEPGSDPITALRASVAESCSAFTYTNPLTSDEVEVSQVILTQKSFSGADSTVSSLVKQKENSSRGMSNSVNVAVKNTIIIKTFASQFSEQTADGSLKEVLEKVGQISHSSPQ